jgi:DNA-binding transcriptional ArsR family regulator
MASDKYLLFSLEDEKSKKLGEVISNSTCKKIISVLAESELSENDLAKKLSLPINTIEYNLKKLLHAGILETSKNFFWSVRGKKIQTYKIANKLIVISPKKTFMSKITSLGILPAVLIAGIATGAIAFYNNYASSHQIIAERVQDTVLQAAPTTVTKLAESGASATPNLIATATSVSPTNPVMYFAAGTVLVIVLIIVFNWKKIF